VSLVQRSWIRAGILGWAAVACVWAVDVGLQLKLHGSPVWWALPNALLSVAPGAALTPLVFLAFRHLLPGAPGLFARVARYAAIGIAFWLTWSVLVFGMAEAGWLFGEPETVGLATSLFRQVAGFSFNSLILYSVMVMLHEAARGVREARRQELRTSRLQAELTRARTAALQAQLNPHFLFNTLHVAAGLTQSDVTAARAVLSDLGELLRSSLADSGEQLVPLRDEIRLVERYAGIQRARFGDRLKVEFEVDPDTLSLGVPPLLLQPLVENAVVHGVSRLEEGGRVRVTARRERGRLRLAVVDSGRGFGVGRPSPPRERVGIGGTRARLELLFGGDANLEFSYPPEGGFKVEVVMREAPTSPRSAGPVPATGPASEVAR
jgi:two-component system, LytTR family, sensor kinase